MDRNYFFSSICFKVLTILLASSFFNAILVSEVFCSQNKFKVFNVKNVVRLDREKEKDYKDYFINFGAADGAKIGRTLKVHRQTIKHSEIESITDKTIDIPIGVLKVISVEKESCVARLESVDTRVGNPLVEYNTAMIGDIITPVKEKVSEKEHEVIILPEAILFDFDKYSLKKEAMNILNKLAVKISKSDYKRIEIATHTDSIGNNEYNKALSKKRANSIFNYFTKKLELNAKLFTVKGYGESKPISTNKTKEGRQKNRRGEITFYK